MKYETAKSNSQYSWRWWSHFFYLHSKAWPPVEIKKKYIQRINFPNMDTVQNSVS